LVNSLFKTVTDFEDYFIIFIAYYAIFYIKCNLQENLLLKNIKRYKN